MEKKNVSFYGYNDGKAIEIYNCIQLFLPTMISVVVSLFFTVLAFVLNYFYLLVVWVFPAMMCFSYILSISLTGYNDRVFLGSAKKKHSFIVDQEKLIRDGKPINKDCIKVYAFRKFVFLITKRTYYRIPNDEFVGIIREEFLLFMKNAGA